MTFLTGRCPHCQNDQIVTRNFSHFVARPIWRERGVSPRCSRAHRLQRRLPLRCFLAFMDTTFDLRHTARNCAYEITRSCEAIPPRQHDVYRTRAGRPL